MKPHYYTPLKIKTTKEGSRSLIETPPEVIGEGTYGCVHRPSLRCDKGKGTSKINYKGKISKLGTKKTINAEIAEYKTIDQVDKSAFFYPGTPNICRPMKDEPTLEAIDKCSDFESKKVDKYKLLIMNDGGENLEDFAKRVAASGDDISARSQMEKFWIEAHRMFLGLSKFLEAGIVHHDLKHKNIVYNQKLNRINFIDFGLMTTIETIRNESRRSIYGFSIRHWSFPPEMAFINYDAYLKITEKDPAKPSKSEEKTTRQKEYAKYLNELRDSNSHINTIFMITVPDFKEKKQESFYVQEHTNEYYRMIMTSLLKNEYNEFLDKTISTIDSYGLATGLIYVLNKTRFLIDEQLANDLFNLFSNMMNFNVMERISINDAMSRYEDILQNNRILEKYNKHFENHELISENNDIVQQSLSGIKIPDVNISDARLESDPESKCPPSTTFNKKKKRCIRSKRKRTKTTASKTKRAKYSDKADYSMNL